MRAKLQRIQEDCWRVDHIRGSECRERILRKGGNPMVRAIVAVFLILWLLGAILHIGGAAIHVLVIAAVALLIYDLVTRRNAKSR